MIGNLRDLMTTIKLLIRQQFPDETSSAVARRDAMSHNCKLAYQITSFYDDIGTHKLQIVIERQPLLATTVKEPVRAVGFQTIPTKSSGDDLVPKPSLLKE